MEAYILIKTTGGKARDILEAVKGMNGVELVDGTYGSYDIVVRAKADDLAGLVVDKIRKLEGV
ncbi:MAG: Lrp/AsnC ligand binding domain-containing protein, partial [Candidatus Altiarchaeota archaeon]|nr:Lrp/AsnC ligand binding domain-containing protein [Candidatus Altiarchaeota archaeon]